MKFFDLPKNETVLFDGAMGTMLHKAGLTAGELPEEWNFSHPDELKKIHLAYLEAGSRVISTNTFGANRFKLALSGMSVEETVKKAISNAREAVSVYGKDAVVAVSIGPLGKMMRPVGELSFDEAYGAFKEIVLAAQGADLILFETFTHTLELKAAVLAAKENSILPVAATMSFDEDGRLLSGGNVLCMAAMLEGLGVDALGLNCSLGPVQFKGILPKLKSVCSAPIICNANAGLPRLVDGETVYNLTPEEFAHEVTELVRLGANYVGGCCGTTPEHIARVAQCCKSVEAAKVEKRELTVVSSHCMTVDFGEKPIVIGERINPTGKPKFKQALRDGDIGYILNEAVRQQECGAQVLDVNLGLPEIDECAMLVEAVEAIQGVSVLPLQIDTTNPAAMEGALRIYNGKPMINSVNGKKESMETVFPLAKKYGGVVVCLTLDENGIPETADGRVAIAKRIIDTAKQYGIDKKDLIIDPLTITVSTDPSAALTTLDALSIIRHELGVHTVLGVSNVSFGLPQRERINTSFFLYALTKGLSAGIINPNSEAMMSAYRSYCVLGGFDEGFSEYIAQYAQAQDAPTVQTQQLTLKSAIVKGFCSQAAQLTDELLKNKDKLAVINEDIIPALDEVGAGFERGTLFLPQLLTSARAARSAFDVVKAYMSSAAATKCKVLLATVEGDVHDIGKNILAMLLENYGYEVVDLGKDVSAQTIVDKVLEENITIVGLSALMTTTVDAMAQTVSLIHEKAPFCKVMVGGAVLTQTYADMIGANFYGKDAMSGVRFCQTVDNGAL